MPASRPVRRRFSTGLRSCASTTWRPPSAWLASSTPFARPEGAIRTTAGRATALEHESMSHTIFQLLHIDRFGWRSLVDIIVLTVIIYQILRIFRGTRAFRMLYGILVLVIAYILTEPGRMMALPTVNRVLGALLLFTPLAIVVLFQNHIRRMLAIVGSNPLAGFTRTPGAEKIIEELVLAAATLSSKRHGALVVLEREQGLRTFAETGIEIDSAVSYDLLTTIFMP